MNLSRIDPRIDIEDAPMQVVANASIEVKIDVEGCMEVQ